MRYLVTAAVRLYQIFISPILRSLGGSCRFYPSCSAYFVEAVNKHGVFSGSWMGIIRILRCHPFSPGGVDLVK